jgi:hypothetical protein
MCIWIFVLSVINLILLLIRRMDTETAEKTEVFYCHRCQELLTFDSLLKEHIANHETGKKEPADEPETL